MVGWGFFLKSIRVLGEVSYKVKGLNNTLDLSAFHYGVPYIILLYLL